MPSNVVKLETKPWSHPCRRFWLARSMKFCGRCGFSKLNHPKLITCNACGCEYQASKGETNGYAQCDEHAGKDAIE